MPVKIVSPLGWSFDDDIMKVVKVSSRGLIGNDRRDFLKTASHEFLNFFDNVKVAKDEVPVHQIALGATEAYGPNRNGDGFSEAACKKYHSSFVKNAKPYRNHKNKAAKGDPYFGKVAASAYNEPMRRVELLTLLNATKEAADRNGGFVADSELRKLSEDGYYPVSMACHVDRDVCSYCKNSARTREEYCTEDTCKAGGCQGKLATLVKVGGDLHHLHVDNPDPLWFDISHVYRGADRTAFGTKADYLTKRAFDELFLDPSMSQKLASHVEVPAEVFLLKTAQHALVPAGRADAVTLASALEQAESAQLFKEAMSQVPDERFPVEKLAAWGTAQCTRQLAALADNGIILSLSEYAQLTDKQASFDDASKGLPTVFSDLWASEKIIVKIAEDGSGLFDSPTDERSRMLAQQFSSTHSMFNTARSLVKAAGGRQTEFTPVQSGRPTTEDGQALLEDYALYKIAALFRCGKVNERSLPLTALAALSQNHNLRP